MTALREKLPTLAFVTFEFRDLVHESLSTRAMWLIVELE
jgi:hypothetical protein